MDSSQTSSNSSNMEDSQEILTTYSLATMLTVENNPSNAFVYFSPIKSSILKTSSFSEATTNVLASIGSMDSMTNVF